MTWLEAPDYWLARLVIERGIGAIYFIAFGLALSALVVLGVPDGLPLPLEMLVWLVLWALYLSIVNVGQTFYSFGWETLLIEAGFFAAFLGPSRVAPSALAILMVRWML